MIHWLEAADVLLGDALSAPLVEAEADILAHMNQDHGEALDLMAQALLGLEGEAWRIVAIDPEGCDLRRGERLARVTFEQPITDGPGARKALVALTKRARNEAKGAA